MAGPVSLRPTVPSDRDLLLEIYRSTRGRELDAVPWSAAERDAFTVNQFDAQDHHYRAYYPKASFSVIVAGDQLAGRLYVDRSEADILIIDIALLPEQRRQGIGRRLVAAIADEGRRVVCHVEVGNPVARAFWESVGFVETEALGAHVEMRKG